MQRSAGILLHPTSLPGPYGVGRLGKAAYAWVDRLSAAGIRHWQILPLGPTGFGNSPYQCDSAFAGNPLLIDPDILVRERLLEPAELNGFPQTDPHRVDYERLLPAQKGLLKKAFSRFEPSQAYETFCGEHAVWLDDYALFAALSEHFDAMPWQQWPEALRRREPETLHSYAARLKDECDFHRFVQFCFFSQWEALKSYAQSRKVHIIGDLPIYVADNSADVWSHPEYFQLDYHLRPEAVAGVPPDYFSETGQRWGNPLFDWDTLEKDGFSWWIHRLKHTLAMVDRVRIDHFRGFEAYWAIPADEETAVNGTWLPGPGGKLFDAFRNALGDDLPIIAEDLGIITPEVEKLRDDYGLPGMKILQFAFGADASNPYLPHNHVQNCVVYTGTHDNDTTNGWFYAEPPQEHTRSHAMTYLHCGWEAFHTSLNRAALASVAALAVLPLQDLLGLGSDARMNTPGTAEGNWRWRVGDAQLADAPFGELHRMCRLYGRA